MSKRIAFGLTFAVLAAAVTPAFGQNAQEIVKKLQGAYANAKTFQATLLQTTDAGQMGKMTTRTQLKMAGNKMSATSSPVGQATGQMAMMSGMSNTRVVNDGKNTWIYLPSMKRHMKMPSGAGPMAQANIKDMLKGLKDAKLAGSETVGGKSTTVITASPAQQQRGGPAMKFRLYVDRAANQLVQLKMDGKGGPGGQQTIAVSVVLQNQKFNQPIPASEFKFTPPPGSQEGFGGMGPGGGPGGGAPPRR